MTSQYTLDVYADESGEIDPYRIDRLLADAKRLGGDTAPVEYIKPIEGGDPQSWGLRIRIVDEQEGPA